MTFHKAAKAVELKELIDHAPYYLPQIGRCISLEKEFNEHYKSNCMNVDSENEDSEDSDSEDSEDKTSPIEPIQNKLIRLYETKGYHMSHTGLIKSAEITVLGKKFKCDQIFLKDVENWYTTALHSGFGNVKEQETQHNNQVRSSRELDTTQFEVGKRTLDSIAEAWAQKFIPDSVTVQPYKLVIYGPGDHFQFHKDTPEENLCGTFLVSLYQNCEPSEVFEVCQDGQIDTWSEITYGGYHGWCAFYPDIPHQVKAIESGYRAILSFKIFGKDVKAPSDWSNTSVTNVMSNDVAEEVEKLNAPLGIILKHHYGYDSKTIYGCDRLLLDALKAKEISVELKPVLIFLNGRGADEYNKVSVETRVYCLADDSLDIVRRGLSGDSVELEETDEQCLSFIDGQRWSNDGLWERIVQQYAEYTGNESNPYSEKTVYVRYAAIVKPKRSED
jgi:hypothetical protein